jgi:membrane protein DedA with SNARE-associated domain
VRHVYSTHAYVRTYLAGSLRLRFKKSLLVDALAFLYLPTLYHSLGVIFHKTPSSIIHKTKGVTEYYFFGAAFVFAGLIMFFVKMGKGSAR